MKIRLLLYAAAFFACGWPGSSLAAAPAHASHPAPAVQTNKTQSSNRAPAPVVHIQVAPADEYFGHQKLSILGVNNTIHDTNARIGFDPPHAAKYYGTLAAAEDALQDWAHKYPQDTWLPGRAYYMSHVFWQMHTSDSDAAANRCRALLFKQFPKSHWAVLARKETRDGVAPVAPADIAAQNAPNENAKGAAAASTATAAGSAAVSAGAATSGVSTAAGAAASTAGAAASSAANTSAAVTHVTPVKPH